MKVNILRADANIRLGPGTSYPVIEKTVEREILIGYDPNNSINGEYIRVHGGYTHISNIIETEIMDYEETVSLHTSDEQVEQLSFDELEDLEDIEEVDDLADLAEVEGIEEVEVSDTDINYSPFDELVDIDKIERLE